MPDYWEVSHARAQQTNAVWSTHNAAFMVGTIDLATHQANTALMFVQAVDVVMSEDALDESKDLRDENLELIHTLNTRVPQLIQSNLPDKDLLQNEVNDVLGVKLGSMAREMQRARRLKSLWVRANAKRGAMIPPLPAIDRNGKVIADLTTAMNAQPGLLQDVADKQAEFNQTKSVLEATNATVDGTNKDWYQAWSNYYDVGSPEHDALSQIETEQGTSAPGALQIDSLVLDGLQVDVSYVAGGGARATTLTLRWQIAGIDPGFDHSEMVILGGQTIGPFVAGQTINVKTEAANSVGVTESTVVSIVAP